MCDYSEELQQILKSERIVEFDRDIRTFSKRMLRKHFSSASGRIILTRVIKSIIWQIYRRIKEGKEAKIIGNIRTFWYRYVKVVIMKIPKKDIGKTDPYDIMTRLFSEMVFELKLFRYRDFDFSDENWENRRIGTCYPEVLVFAEKRGWIRYLRDFHERYGVSILALGGFPSSLTSEYTSLDIQKITGKSAKIRLIGIVDFDPSGALIAKSFRGQLEQSGLKVDSLELLIEPKYYTAEELALYRYRLPKKQRTKLSNWLEDTGGIEGEAYGLESESMPIKKLELLLKTSLNF